MRYYFEAIDQQGVPVIGKYEAETEAEVSEHLQKRQLIPLIIRPEGGVFNIKNISFFEGITAMDRIALVRNLAATTKAGLSIIEALDILAQDAEKPLLKKILLEMKSNMQNGQPLWQSFQYYRRYFPPFFVGMIRAAESSGKLDTTLDELTQYLTREYSLVKKVKNSLAYPILLLFASGGVIILLLGFVLPSLEKTFQRSQMVLPAYTRALMSFSHGIRYNIWGDAIFVLVIIAIIVFFRRNAWLKKLVSRWSFSVPLLRDVLKKIVLVRFTRTLGSLLGSGALITESLQLAADSVGNEYYRQAILKVNAEVIRGLPLSKALSGSDKLFPRFLISLVMVGEKTGTLEHILKTFANFYDEEVENSLRTMTTFLEPAMLLVMGLVIGFIALSVLLPIYQFVGKFI
ncbi:MAG: type II secretion system F family protein [Patescibacteria group bacterium]|nr:type II secretion system F family protein [Patescibacteria group bacterium]